MSKDRQAAKQTVGKMDKLRIMERHTDRVFSTCQEKSRLSRHIFCYVVGYRERQLFLDSVFFDLALEGYTG